MNKKILFSLFVLIILVGIVLSEGETVTTNPSPTKTVEVSGDTQTPIGNLIGEGIGNSDITVKDVQYIKKENENTLISFLKGGAVIINGVKFENITESSTIELDKTGKIAFANLTASKDTFFNFKDIGSTFKCSQGQRAIYKDGKITFDKGNGKDSFSFRQDVYDSSGNNIGRFMNVKMNGQPVSIEKSKDGNNVFTGNFDIGTNKVNGRISLSKEGQISEIWKGTDATVNNVDFNISGNNLKVYYDEAFNSADHKGENYFNYKKDKISIGGDGFTSDLTKSTNIYGDMKTAKTVTGIGTKSRNLEINMNGGDLEISKDVTNTNDMSFNIKSDGKFTINNGRDFISSDGTDVLVKANEDKEGTLYSYNLNFNNGEYKLEDNLFKNRAGDILVNTNTPWENVVYIARNTDSIEAKNIRLDMQKSGKLIFVDEPNFLTWIKGADGEAIMKGIYTGTQTASQNIDGIKVSPLEVYGVMKAEGAGYKPADSTRIPFFETFEKDPNKVIIGTDVGLTMVGSADYIAKLKAGGYIPEDLKVSDYPSYTELTKQTPPRLSAEDAFTYVAGVVAYKKKVFFNDFKELYGEEELSKLTPDEESYWTTWYYWGEQYGIAKNALKNREQNYIKVWEGPEPKQEIDPVSGKVKNWNEIGNYLSRHRTDFEEYLQKLELFNYP